MQRLPHAGDFIGTNSKVVNLADMMAFRDRYDLLSQTIKNGAVEFGKRCLVPSAVSTDRYLYALDIPEGRRLYIWQRNLTLTQGRYEVDLVSYPSGWSGGTLAFKKTLSQGAASSVQTDLYCGVTPNVPGEVETVIELPLVDTGTGQTGQSRVAGAASVEGVLKSFTDGAVLISVKRTEAADYTSSIVLIVWEEDA